MKLKVITITSAILAALSYSCSWHNVEEDLVPCPQVTDTTPVSFNDSIFPIVVRYCTPAGSGNGCHLPGSVVGPELVDYASIKAQVDGSRIQERVIAQTPSSMPPATALQLTPCDLALIQRWIDLGAPNN